MSVKFCRERDRLVLDLIERHRFLSLEQISKLVFEKTIKEQETAKKKARSRMTQLYKDKKVKRKRLDDNNTQYVYFNQYSNRYAHYLGVNEIYIQLLKQKKSRYKIRKWITEIEVGNMRPDVLGLLEGTICSSYIKFFIEYDSPGNRNEFDKIEKYNAEFEKVVNGLAEYWWISYNNEKRFPVIVVVTERKKTVLKKVKSENKHGLKFIVLTLAEVKEGRLWEHLQNLLTLSEKRLAGN